MHQHSPQSGPGSYPSLSTLSEGQGDHFGQTGTLVLTAQVRLLMAARQSPGWQFSTLFLVKDSLAVMLESAHMYEDGLREYSELEACYLEALAAGGPLSQQPFGEEVKAHALL